MPKTNDGAFRPTLRPRPGFRDRALRKRVQQAILRLEEADSIDAVASVRKLAGFAECYRMRIGDYRIGLILVEDGVELVRFLHRSVVYDRFP